MFRFWRRDHEEEDKESTILGGIPLGPRPWLVLGGGGLKGLTHLGAWKALLARGFEPSGIVGTSVGALVGAALAAGRDVDELMARARKLTRSDIARIQRRALWVSGFRAEALFQEEPFREYLAEVLPEDGWEALQIRFQANAVELGSACTEWFGIGARTDVPLKEAIYASAALPVFYPAAALPGGLYVDGGVEFALPLERAAELGATGIVAIDPGAAAEADVREVGLGGMLAMHQRVFSIMSGRLRREAVRNWSGPPLLYLRPRLDGYGTFDFDSIGYFLEEGERAMNELLGEEPAADGESGPERSTSTHEDAPSGEAAASAGRLPHA